MGRRIETLGDLGRYDRLYVSPHFDDAGFSCPASLLEAKASGTRALVACLFTGGAAGEAADAGRLEEEAAAADRAGFDFVTAGFPDAPFRGPEHRDFNGIVWGTGPRDGELVRELTTWIVDLIARACPRELFAPLGVGRHIDHRLAHDACRGAAAKRGLSTWFYEDRPYAFVNQAAEVRLRELGCDVMVNPDKFFRAFWKARYVETHLREKRERMACRVRYEAGLPGPAAGFAAPESRLAVPVDLEAVWAVVSSYASQLDAFVGDRLAWEQACREAARRMGSASPGCERAWSLGEPTAVEF
jgi:LmbE family N-acetylglucosaminyl deacetylase